MNSEGKHLIINNNYWLYESAITPAQCKLIIEEADWSKKHTAEHMKKKDSVVNKNIRETTVTFAPSYSAIGCIMQSHIYNINAHKYHYDISGMQDIQIGHYTEGSHYDWHPDISEPDDKNMQRKLSAVLMLSDANDYEGGLLEFKFAEMPKLQKGSLVVFPSFMVHRVTKVTKGNRYTVVAWSVGPSFR